MYGDEYLYQKLGYKHIAAKFKNMTEEEIKKAAVHISEISVEIPTQKDIAEYKKFRKANYELQMIKSDGFYKALLLLFDAVFAGVELKCAIGLLRAGIYDFGAIFLFLFLISAGAFVFCVWVIVKMRSHLEKPIGVTYGYIIGSSMCTQERHMSYDPYVYTVEHNSFSDIWIEKEDKYLYKIPQTLYAFKYKRGEYRWSELVYTPVKVLVFPRNRIEIMPAF